MFLLWKIIAINELTNWSFLLASSKNRDAMRKCCTLDQKSNFFLKFDFAKKLPIWIFTLKMCSSKEKNIWIYTPNVKLKILWFQYFAWIYEFLKVFWWILELWNLVTLANLYLKQLKKHHFLIGLQLRNTLLKS